jgi:hypothetical protein
MQLSQQWQPRSNVSIVVDGMEDCVPRMYVLNVGVKD